MRPLFLVSIVIGILFILGALVFLIQEKEEVPVTPEVSQEYSFPSIEYSEDFETVATNIAPGTLKEDYSTFITNYAGQEEWLQFEYNGLPVSLSQGLDELDAEITPALKELLKETDWGILSCEGNASAPTYMLRVEMRLLPDYAGDLYKEQVDFMKNWESTIVYDVATLLFPYQFYSSPVTRGGFYNDQSYSEYITRSVQVSFDNNEGSLSYLILDDFILISSDMDCMIRSAEYLVEND